MTDVATLRAFSELAGEAAYAGGDKGDIHAPVMTPAMIRQLPMSCALVIRGGLSPVVARLPMVWKDSAYRTARRQGWATAALSPPAAQAIPSLSEPELAASSAPATAQAAEPEPELADAAPYPWS